MGSSVKTSLLKPVPKAKNKKVKTEEQTKELEMSENEKDDEYINDDFDGDDFDFVEAYDDGRSVAELAAGNGAKLPERRADGRLVDALLDAP